MDPVVTLFYLQGPNMVTINSTSTNPLVYSSAVFSTANYVALQGKKFNDLAEYTVNILNTKIPKLWTKVGFARLSIRVFTLIFISFLYSRNKSMNG
jgi:hypothetical protein